MIENFYEFFEIFMTFFNLRIFFNIFVIVLNLLDIYLKWWQSQISEIQQWCNETLKQHEKQSKVNSFKDKDLANAVIDLCDIISPGSVDYSIVHKVIGDFMPPEQRLENAQLAINISRKIGAKIYASPMDLVEGKQKMILTVFVGLMSRSFEKANPAETASIPKWPERAIRWIRPSELFHLNMSHRMRQIESNLFGILKTL